jgi:hypothetical protein
MDIDIGAKKPIDGDQVFLVGRFLTYAEPPFVLLYDSVKRRRAKRNIQKVDPIRVVASMGSEHFIELDYPGWGKVWLRTSSVRGVRDLSKEELVNSSKNIGSLLLFHHDPTPEDEHAGFFFFGMSSKLVASLLNLDIGERQQ